MLSNYRPVLFIHEELTDFQDIRDDGTDKTLWQSQKREAFKL